MAKKEGTMAITPLSSAAPYYRAAASTYITLEDIKRLRPEWGAIAEIAFNSVGRISMGGSHLGCGVLVGIDRLLVPFHVLEGHCLDALDILFEVDSGESCYLYSCKAVALLSANRENDFCLLQVSPICGFESMLPGNLLSIPGMSWERAFSDTLMVHVADDGSKVLSLSSPCSRFASEDLCSYHPTTPGSSGGACFTKAGLLAMHRARSTGLCGRPASERSAILLSEIAKRCHLLALPACMRLCPPKLVKTCLPTFLRRDLCYEEEKGGRPVINGIFCLAAGKICRYWETRPTHASGAGPRGIRVVISPDTRSAAELDIFLRFNENPHDFREYNKDPEPFYKAAAQAVCASYKPGTGIVGLLGFEALGGAYFTMRLA